MLVIIATLFLAAVSAQAQSLLPIPTLPSTPTLPLSINTNGYFVFSWSPNGGTGQPVTLDSTNVPVEVRSGVVKVGSWTYGNWYLKTNGKVIIYSGQGGGGASPTKISLPNFYTSNIANFYIKNSMWMLGLSSSGQMGFMSGTNTSTFSQPVGGTNVVDFLPSFAGDEGLLTLHANGEIKAWIISGTNISLTNHVASQLANVKVMDGSPQCGLAIYGNGQVFGWNRYNSTNNSPVISPIPPALSSNVVQISSPLDATTDTLFYALKSDGSIVYWNLQGTQFMLPSGFSGKQFVQLVGNVGMNTAFALTRQGELMGWRRSWDGTLETVSLPAAFQAGISQIKTFTDSMGRGLVIALSDQGQIIPLAELGGSGWGVDSTLPVGITTSRGGFLGSFVSGSGASSSSYALSSDGDLAVQTYSGLPLDVLAKLVAEKIAGITNNYGLATPSSINTQITNSIAQMVSNTLATKTELSNSLAQSRTDGINSVISNPNLWTLYTTNQIKAMIMGDLMLTRTNNGQFVLNYDIEQSDNLTNWAPYQGFALPLTNLPTDKAFVRIKLKNQQ